MRKFLKTCSIYRKPQCIYLFAHLHTDYGELGRPPLTKLPLTVTAPELGHAVLQSLDSVTGQVVDVDLKQTMAALRAHLAEISFKTAAAFEKNASVVGVEFDGESYKIVSTQKDKNDANLHSTSKTLTAAATADELGTTILASFQ